MGNKPHKIELLMFLIAVIVLGIGLYYLGPSITGFVIKELSYEDDLNLVVTASGNYTWQLKDNGDLRYVKLVGRVTTSGNARAYIENNGVRYLIFDSARIGKWQDEVGNESGNLITGFAVKEDKGEDKDENKTESAEEFLHLSDILYNFTYVPLNMKVTPAEAAGIKLNLARNKLLSLIEI